MCGETHGQLRGASRVPAVYLPRAEVSISLSACINSILPMRAVVECVSSDMMCNIFNLECVSPLAPLPICCRVLVHFTSYDRRRQR